MGEVFVTFSIVVAVFSISFLLFGGWVMMLTFKGASRLMGSFFVPPMFTGMRQSAGGRECGKCHQLNPAAARYCRRCGGAIR